MEADALTLVLATAITAVLVYIQLSRSEPDLHPLRLREQASLTNIRNEHESVIHRPVNAGQTGSLTRRPSEKVKTLHDVWQAGFAVNANARSITYMFQHQFSFVDETFDQVDRRISNFGTGFIKATGLKSKAEVPVGIMTPYCHESFIAQQAFYRYSFVAVPIHELRNNGLLIEVVNQTKLKAILISDKALPLLLESLQDCTSVKTIITTGIYISKAQEELAQKHGVKILKFGSVEYDGSHQILDPVTPDPEDLAMINYSTKSKSLSKGVMLTHGNLVAAMTAFNASLPFAKRINSKDRFISHFSNGDVISVWLSSAVLLEGGSLIFPSGLMKNVLYDVQATHPTIFASTPVILEKTHEALHATYGKGSLFQKAFVAKKAILQSGRITQTSLWDFIGLGELRSRLGGKTRLMVTTYPTKESTLEFIRAALGIPVVSVYGRTEASGLVTCRNMLDYSTVPYLGGPAGCNEIKLKDDAQSGYACTDEPLPRGEVLIRGPNVMRGYFKKPSATSTAIDQDGWLHTFDLGGLHANGALEILGTMKKPKSTLGVVGSASPSSGDVKE